MGEQLAAIKEDNTGEAKRNITHMRQRLAKWKWRLDLTRHRGGRMTQGNKQKPITVTKKT